MDEGKADDLKNWKVKSMNAPHFNLVFIARKCSLSKINSEVELIIVKVGFQQEIQDTVRDPQLGSRFNMKTEN